MITLKKSGIIYKNHDGKDSKVQTVIPFLDEIIEIDNDFTLWDFFKILKGDPKMYETVFSSPLGHHPLDPFIQDIDKKKKAESDDLTCIEVYWGTEQYLYQGKNDIAVHVCTHGVSFSPKTGRRKQNYAIEFTPLYELKKLPIVLNRDFVMYPPWNKTIGKKVKPVVKGRMNFTVYNVFSGILDELSFMGEPVNRDKEMENLNERIKEAKDKPDKDFVPFKDFVDSLNGKKGKKCQGQKK